MIKEDDIKYMKVDGIPKENIIKLELCIRCTGKTYSECDHSLCEKKGVNNG